MIMKLREIEVRSGPAAAAPMGIIVLDRLPPQPDPRVLAFVWSAPGEQLPDAVTPET